MIDLEKVASYYTTAEAAKVLRVSGDTVRRWVREGQLEAVVIGKRDYRISPEALAKMVTGVKDE